MKINSTFERAKNLKQGLYAILWSNHGIATEFKILSKLRVQHDQIIKLKIQARRRLWTENINFLKFVEIQIWDGCLLKNSVFDIPIFEASYRLNFFWSCDSLQEARDFYINFWCNQILSLV